MKTRHIIMIFILIIALSIFISNNGVSHLTCVATGTLYESPSKSTLDITLQNDKIKDLNMTVDLTLNEELMKQRETLIQNIEAQGKSEVEKTRDGLRLTSLITNDYFAGLGLSKNSSYGELKQVLELQGFTCK